MHQPPGAQGAPYESPGRERTGTATTYRKTRWLTVVRSVRSASARPACFPHAVSRQGPFGVAGRHCSAASTASRRQSRGIAPSPPGPPPRPGHRLPIGILERSILESNRCVLESNRRCLKLTHGVVFSYAQSCVKPIVSAVIVRSMRGEDSAKQPIAMSGRAGQPGGGRAASFVGSWA